MSTINIPGLLARKTTAEEAKLTNAELQGKRDQFAKQIASWKPDNNSGITNISPHLAAGGYGPYPGSGLTPFGDYQKDWKNPGPFGDVKSSPNRQRDMAELDLLRQYIKPQRSSFEDLLDTMFDTAEKEQFLISLGFEFEHVDGKDFIKRVVGGLIERVEKSTYMDKIFLREITLKFKNLLLTKATLKIKI